MNLTIRKYAVPKRKKVMPRLVCVLVGLFILSCLVVAALGLVEDVFPADVAVVLGNEVDREGNCSPRLQARLDRAVELYNDQFVPIIIVSGGVGRSGYDEVTAMRAYLLGKGVPDEAVIMDKNGINTKMTAKFTATYMKERGYTKVLAVSQYFHLPRTKMSLENEGGLTVGTARPFYFEFRDLYSLVREVPALVLYKAGVRD